jgi:hypothetical protein
MSTERFQHAFSQPKDGTSPAQPLMSPMTQGRLEILERVFERYLVLPGRHGRCVVMAVAIAVG